MSLATRCPSCGTVFRVVRDQLKVSEGWVRCGRCTEVFNAAERLFELEPAVTGSAPAVVSPTLLRADPAEAVVPPPPPPPPTPEAAAAQDTPAAPEPASPSAAPAATPEFLRRAELAARRRQPARRGPMALLALLLAALLAGQIGLHYRDALAAGWPATRPVLQAACGLFGCRVEAPLRIGQLRVDSSGLLRVPDSTLYRLSLVVRNHAPTAVRMPAVELALSDAQGLTTARRVFSADELGQRVSSLPAGSETPLQATLDLGEQRVAGYTVELFYP